MSIASEITRITGNISDAYTAAQAKGATMPTTQNSDNLATTISTISGGGVDTTGWIPRIIDANGKLVFSSTAPNFSGVKDVGDRILYYAENNNTLLTGAVNFPALTTISGNNAMSYAFDSCTGLTSVSFPALTTISGYFGMQYAFNGCRRLTSVDLSALTTISNSSAMSHAFSGCTGLTSLDLSALTTISGNYGMNNAFNGCTGLTSVDLSALTTISGSYGMANAFSLCAGLTSVDLSALTTISDYGGMENTFSLCAGLTSVSFPALTTISGNGAMGRAFNGCTGLTSVSFPALKSDSFGSYIYQFNNMLQSVTGCTIHFPSNLDPQTGSTVISGLAGYPNFGGTNTVLAFDLPATE